ncbi:hypothetical protein DPEC_G00215410 [Dallia pectoralis]|uniref:Uncharacterized protein n=1 Tax=Dallia pectoralis TaxID=75939 RepID=A0ACC2G2B7_DALPE|nr:hypothetical protein DPEC_G00215410 [Dallia pectoralis]
MTYTCVYVRTLTLMTYTCVYVRALTLMTYTCVYVRAWVVSMGTSGCGWTVILAWVIAVHGPDAPHLAALYSQLRRTSPWSLWRCGVSGNPLRRKRERPEARGAFWMQTLRHRPCWR